MSAIVESENLESDPGTEMRRLQDLVQKLEQQNHVLRTKHTSNEKQETNDNVISSKMFTKTDDNSSKTEKSMSDTDSLTNALRNCSVEDNEILELSNFQEDEESWLYKSPKRPSPSQKCISPYKWIRQEFEHPSPEVESAKRSLSYKLDECARISRSPSYGSMSTPSLAASLIAPHVQNDNGMVTDVQSSAPTIKKSLFGGSKLDTNTFTRPKNKSALASSRLSRTDTYTKPKSAVGGSSSPNNLSPRLHNDSHSPHRDSGGEESGLSPRSAGKGRSVSPRGLSPRDTPERDRNGNTTRSNGSGGLVTSGALTNSDNSLDSRDGEGSGGGVGGSRLNGGHHHKDIVDVQVMAHMQEESLRQSLNQSPKKAFKNRSAAQQINHVEQGDSNHSSNRSSPGRFDGEVYRQIQRSNNSLASLSSHSNSPPDSPYGSQYLDQRQTGANKPSGLLMSPQQVRRSGGGIPTPRTGIPRPGQSRLPAPRTKSSIPSPARRVQRGQPDDSWKDGCF